MHIDEGTLRFHFGPGWDAVKYDSHPLYAEIQRSLDRSGGPGTKGVDFVASNGKAVTLVEVKDFRQGREQNRDLVSEVSLKVRDTCAGLVAACRRRQDAPWPGVAASLCDESCPLFVVLFLEQASGVSGSKARLSTRMSQLRTKLSWLSMGRGRSVAVVDRAAINERPLAGIERVSPV